MTESEFDAFFRPEWDAFVKKVLTDGIAAIESDENYGPEARRVHRHGTRCNARHDFFVAIGKQEMQYVDGIRYCETSSKDLFIFGDRLAVSFNLLDKKNLLVRMNKTKQSHLFQMQRLIQDKDLPPELLYIIAGYTVDELGNPKELWLTCPAGNRNRWVRRLSVRPLDDVLETLSPSTSQPQALPYRIIHEDVEEIQREEEEKYGTDGSVEESS